MVLEKSALNRKRKFVTHNVLLLRKCSFLTKFYGGLILVIDLKGSEFWRSGESTRLQVMWPWFEFLVYIELSRA